jgi:8-oxo-dGTP pyrophosphatase MutT (NUDIX family)
MNSSLLYKMNEANNPWQIIGEKNIYDNKWINLTEYDVINPSGGKGIYGKVHFKNIAIGIVPIDEDHNTYLVGQYRFTINQYSWEIPEGGGPLNELPLAAAQRELLEEAGLKAANWQKIMEMYPSNSVTDEHCIVFVATGLTRHTAMPEETEQIAIKKLPFNEAYEMVMQEKITDAISAAAIMKVKLLMLEGKINLLSH